MSKVSKTPKKQPFQRHHAQKAIPRQTFHFSICDILYPRQLTSKAGFVIAKVFGYFDKASSLSNTGGGGGGGSVGELSQFTLKGMLPYMAPYFYYSGQVIVQLDPVYGEYIQMKKVLNVTKADVLTVEHLEWVLMKELHFDQRLWYRTLHSLFPRVRPGQVQMNSIVDLTRLPSGISDAIQQHAAFFRFEDYRVLTSCFPNLTQELQRGPAEEMKIFRQALTKEPWKFCFKIWLVEFIGTHLAHLALALNLDHLDLFGDTDSFETLSYNLLKEHFPSSTPLHLTMVKNYQVISDWLSKRGDTCFQLEQLPRSLGIRTTTTTTTTTTPDSGRRGGPESLDSMAATSSTPDWVQGLVDNVFALTAVAYGNTTQYSLTIDYSRETALLNVIRRLCDNHPFKTRPSQSSLSSDCRPESLRAVVSHSEKMAILDSLNAQQRKAVTLLPKVPVLNIFGMPGRGKTHAIQAMVAIYGASQVAVHSFVGVMVNNLRARGITHATTIHSAIMRKFGLDQRHKRLQESLDKPGRPSTTTTTPGQSPGDLDKSIKNIELQLQEFGKVRVLVIDEYTNVSLALAARAYAIYPNLQCCVHLFDPLQIASIDPGKTAIDTRDGCLPGLNVELQQQLRVSNDASQHIIHNDEMLARRAFSRFRYARARLILRSSSPALSLTSDTPQLCELGKTPLYLGRELLKLSFDAKDPGQINKEAKGWFLVEPQYTPNGFFAAFSSTKLISELDPSDTRCWPTHVPEDRKTLLFAELDSLVEVLRVPRSIPAKTSPAPPPNPTDALILLDELHRGVWQVLTLTNRLRHECNEYFERRVKNYLKEALFADIEQSQRPLLRHVAFYSGQRIMVINGNFDALPVSETLQSDPVHNGEILTVDYFSDYDLVQKKWRSDASGQQQRQTWLQNNNVYACPEKRFVRLLFTVEGKTVCIGRDWVPRNCLTPAWAITVDKSQGGEYAKVLYVLPRQDIADYYEEELPLATPPTVNPHEPATNLSESQTSMWSSLNLPFGINHVHVGISRSKEVVVVLGTWELFQRLAATTPRPRQTGLRSRLRDVMKKHWQSTPSVTAATATTTTTTDTASSPSPTSPSASLATPPPPPPLPSPPARKRPRLERQSAQHSLDQPEVTLSAMNIDENDVILAKDSDDEHAHSFSDDTIEAVPDEYNHLYPSDGAISSDSDADSPEAISLDSDDPDGSILTFLRQTPQKAKPPCSEDDEDPTWLSGGSASNESFVTADSDYASYSYSGGDDSDDSDGD